jgi:hypothetical protein
MELGMVRSARPAIICMVSITAKPTTNVVSGKIQAELERIIE